MNDLGIDLNGYQFIAGIDEAGRGPLFGPVYAAAVILGDVCIEGLDDSKKLSEKKRERLFDEIQQRAPAWSIASVDAEEIDRINILQASMLAMRKACEQLKLKPDLALIDGNRCPDLECASHAVVKGDSRVAEIAAASILAKVARDRFVLTLHQQYPQYALDSHKGYPTRLHLERLTEHGPTPYHRRSFGPVKKLLENI